MYQVDNAIIMAAGLSNRFLPLSLEKPKSLWEVKGEILIERQIKQLIDVGITDITIVVGYLAEKFEYLVEKYNVSLVMNEDFYRYNNTSSLMVVLEKLNNTYICSSDNYFVKNPFKKQLEHSTYPVVYNPNAESEYYVEYDEKNKITDVNIGSGVYCMIGQVFFDEQFSKKFSELLTEDYKNEQIRENLWEYFYMKHIKELDLYIEIVKAEEILEFDSLSDLQEFDESYKNIQSNQVLNNITNVLDCIITDIKNINVLDGGLTNRIFTFEVKNNKYVYRYPGVGTDEYINRVSEFHAHNEAHDNGFDPSLIWIDKKGHKISKYVENFRYFDYENKNDVDKVIKKMKELHDLSLRVDYEFRIDEDIEVFWLSIKEYGVNLFSDIEKIHKKVLQILEKLDYSNAKKVLCHNDIYTTNFLMTKEFDYLIDWEFASDTHPALDLATFIVCSPYDLEKIKEVIKIYLGDEFSPQKEQEFFGYFAVSGFYWLLWALFQESNGQSTGEFLNNYYIFTKIFLNELDITV